MSTTTDLKLQDVIAISGKPGLYKLLNATKSPFTAMDITTGKKFPVFPKDKVSFLRDISMYSENGDTPLAVVFQNLHEAFGDTIPEEGEITKTPETLKGFMSVALPEYDEERVHAGDIKKLAKWYIILRKAGMVLFVDDENDSTEA